MNNLLLDIIKNPDEYHNPESQKLLNWSKTLNDRIKAQKLIKIADKMERKWRNYHFKLN